MTLSLDFVLLLLAFILFVLAALNVKSERVSLVAAGLACWVATLLF